jgi:acetyltransferase-like isoleucine patch superfamily enzyme
MSCRRISEKALLGAGVRIGEHTTVHDHVVLGDGVTIGDYCQIGSEAHGEDADFVLEIGAGSTVRSHTVIYSGSRFGAGLQTGHHALIRDNTRAGLSLRIGSYTDVEGECVFGDYVSCHGYVHVGKGSRIGDFVWLYSLVTLTNDPLPPSFLERPVTLEDGVVVCVGCILMPGTRMRTGSYATAGTLVKGDVAAGAIVSGRDSAVVGHVSHLFDLETMTRHPWMRHYADRYPEEARDRIRRLGERIQASRAAFPNG